jgi:hypothetical protein
MSSHISERMVLHKSRFTEYFVRLNNLDFKRWVFEPGMAFLSESKWWDKGYRGHRHNGLDLRLYVTRNGTIKTMPEDAKIPIIYEGKIVRGIKDFLGYTLFVAHEIFEKNSQLFTIYGHVKQTEDILPGRFLKEGAVITTLAVTNGKVPAHLHLSAVLIPKSIPLEELTWKIPLFGKEGLGEIL